MKRMTMTLLTVAGLGYAMRGMSYDVTNRFVLLEDKFKTEEMLREYGHDFLFDINAYVNKNLLDVIDDAKAVGEKATTAEKVSAGNNFLSKYDKTEQSLRINTAIGIPIFSFSVGGWKISPNLRVGVQAGANVGIRSEALTTQLIADLLEDDLPQEILTRVRSANVSALIGGTTNVGQFLVNQAGVSQALVDQLPEKVRNTTLPNAATVPNLAVYTKIDAKVGFYNTFKKTSNFGFFNLYTMGRVDLLARFDTNQLANDDFEVLSSGEEQNTQMFLMTDIGYGRTFNERYRVRAAIEEIKISRLSDNVAKGGDLVYQVKPLIRVHGEAKWNLSVLSLTPFVGLHKRTQYDLDDGFYIGGDVGAHVWDDRIGLTFRTIIDKEHITLSPMMKLWVMSLQYSLKKPIKDTVDDVKTSAIHSLNFRIFI